MVIGNFKDRSLANSFLQDNQYSEQKLANFVTSISPYTSILEEEPALAAESIAYDSQIVDGEFLDKPELATTVSSTIQNVNESLKTRNQIINYTVVSGDTLSSIARQFNLSIKTLAVSNNLSSVNQIKPDQILSIPPVDGIIYTVAKGDNLSSIVKKYQGNLEETTKYNSANLQPGQKIIIAGGKMPDTPNRTTRLASSRNVVTRDSSSGRTLGEGGNRNTGYPWGWCTWYAAYRRNVPRSWGNAIRWFSSAQATGYATGRSPRPGAIVVTREAWPLGHVAYVESVNGNSLTISEMNFRGFGIISSRTISQDYGKIVGYIY